MKILPKAVLFDWDNTILDCQSQINYAAKKTFVSMGMDPSNYVFYSGPRINYFKQNFGDKWKESEQMFRKYLEEIDVQNISLFEGIKDVLQFLTDNKVYTAIVSNKLSSLLTEEVKHFQLDRFFNKVVGSGDTQFDKPSQEPLIFALHGSGIIPNKNDVLFIGDSIVDMECAKNANVTGIIFNNHIPEYSNNKVVQTFGEFLHYLKYIK